MAFRQFVEEEVHRREAALVSKTLRAALREAVPPTATVGDVLAMAQEDERLWAAFEALTIDDLRRLFGRPGSGAGARRARAPHEDSSPQQAAMPQEPAVAGAVPEVIAPSQSVEEDVPAEVNGRGPLIRRRVDGERVLAYVRARPGCTFDDVVKAIGDPDTAALQIRVLRRRGALRVFAVRGTELYYVT
jgi:hypothetical protein